MSKNGGSGNGVGSVNDGDRNEDGDGRPYKVFTKNEKKLQLKALAIRENHGLLSHPFADIRQEHQERFRMPFDELRKYTSSMLKYFIVPYNHIFLEKIEKHRLLLETFTEFKAIHLIRSLIEKYKERQRDLHMAFLDLEKADMYDGAKTRVRTSIENTEFFPVEVGLHQGSAISPYLFALILDELSRGIQEDIPWCLIFADDIALVSKSAKGLNARLENWRAALEDNDLTVDIRIGDKILQPTESFRYLGSMLHKSGRIDEDVPLKLKGKFYRVAIIPALLYGSECWPITKALANRVEVAELRMLRWTCSRTLSDMIPNGVYRVELESAPVRRVEALVIDGLRRRGRPKLRWEDRVKQDLKELRLFVDMTSDRNDWRARIRLGRTVDYGRPRGEWPEMPSSKALKRLLLVDLWCVDLDAQKRLKMGHVLHMLEADDCCFPLDTFVLDVLYEGLTLLTLVPQLPSINTVVTEETGTATPSQVPSPGTDAFRPTTPGHSPGVGHSIHE
ncbi:ataxia telangiectasia mutated family protein [Tanacetum coccineum]